MPPYAYFKDQFMPLHEAKIGILTQALHYGTAIFGGIRGNWDHNQERFCLFRLDTHYRRLLNGCLTLNIELPYSVDDMCRLSRELVKMSGYREDVYLRPLAYKSSEAIGVKLHDLEDDFFIIVTSLPPYLGTRGVRCCTSGWRRVDDSMVPTRVKVCGIYVNSALAKTDANRSGFDEAILLTPDGHVAEGSGENIFLVIDGQLVTPPTTDNVLPGVTRNTVIQLARNELGIETIERSVDKSELFLAQECFFTGTATNIAEIVEIDHRRIGNGQKGEVTAQLQRIYSQVMLGRLPRYSEWYTILYPDEVPTESSGAKLGMQSASAE